MKKPDNQMTIKRLEKVLFSVMLIGAAGQTDDKSRKSRRLSAEM